MIINILKSVKYILYMNLYLNKIVTNVKYTTKKYDNM